MPSFFKYGWSGGWGGTGSTATLNLTNLWNILNPVEGVLPRFLSFASFELPRFIGDNSVNRWLFVQQHMWLSPVIFLLLVIGILQPVAMVALWFAKQKRESDWQAIKYLTFGTVLLLCVSFMFSLKAPASHTFYLTLPIAMIYSFHCWSNFLMRPASRKFAALFLIGGIVFHVTLALHNFRTISLYVDRKIPVTAIEKNDYRILGERRFGAHY